ncbi:MAG: T9SS type A sorting domain-containing protein [Bacteroidales bacterium]|nr:T9SS type A sorting domain-containing protein [Bacteroidales bacterium]
MGLCVLNDTFYVSTAGREYGLSETVLEERPERLPIYPNPANNHFYIRDISGSTSIRVFDLSGKELRVRGPDSNGMVSVADLDNGVYFIQLIDGSRSGNAKLLVNH